MAYAIMRCKKLKGMGSVAGALKHCFRERETFNADPARTPDNEHGLADSTDKAMGKLREMLPEKRRKDAVLSVEYLITASPQWWKTASPDQQDEFFNRAHNWLADKYGADRLVVATVHRDETTPHLSAFVVPLTIDGRLSAKDFIGDRKRMSQDQTEFAQRVASLGLERGLEGSKAHHRTISEYYARVAMPAPKVPAVDVPEPSVGERLSPRKYGERVAESALAQLTPYLATLRAKANETDSSKEEAKRSLSLARRKDEQLSEMFREKHELNEKLERIKAIAVQRGKDMDGLRDGLARSSDAAVLKFVTTLRENGWGKEAATEAKKDRDLER